MERIPGHRADGAGGWRCPLHRAGRGRYAARSGREPGCADTGRRRRPDDHGDGLYHSSSRCSAAIAAAAAGDRTAIGGGVSMANITLGAIRDYLRAVADWATGQATVAPKVQLSGHNVLHELVWNPTPGSASWRVFGETEGSSAQAIKPFDASRLSILYVRVINQSGAGLSAFGPPYP